MTQEASFLTGSQSMLNVLNEKNTDGERSRCVTSHGCAAPTSLIKNHLQDSDNHFVQSSLRMN